MIGIANHNTRYFLLGCSNMDINIHTIELADQYIGSIEISPKPFFLQLPYHLRLAPIHRDAQKLSHLLLPEHD